MRAAIMATTRSRWRLPAIPSDAPNGYQEAVLEAKRRVIRNALDRAGGVYTEAAKLLDIHPNYLHRLVRSLRLR